jgi:hypothetical protein
VPEIFIADTSPINYLVLIGEGEVLYHALFLTSKPAPANLVAEPFFTTRTAWRQL